MASPLKDDARLPVDPDVAVPRGVAAQAAAAEAAHKAAYATPEPTPPVAPAAPVSPPPPPPAPVVTPQPDPPAPVVTPQPDPPQPAPPPPADENLTVDQWRHRYLSMEGRYKQAAQTIGGMQEQIQEIGDELLRTQAVMRGPGQQQPQPQAPQPLVTEDEVRTYGPDLVDFVQRAARQAVMPDLQNTQSRVDQVDQRVAQSAQRGVHVQLAQEVPDWVAINRSARFKSWCGLRDLYSGQVRGRLLNAAFQAADAPRVIAFFQGFLREEQATGQLPDPLAPQPPPLAPRVAAVPLESLTAPGRAKPATGDLPNNSPADKPIFTRGQIATFYANVRKGSYSGRDAEKAADEAAIFAAQRDGRVRG